MNEKHIDDTVHKPGGMGQQAGPRWDVLLAFVLIVPLIVVHFWTIEWRPFDADEYRTLYVVGASLPTLMEDRLRNAHQPAYFVSAWGVAKIFGSESRFAMRLMPQVIALIALGFLYGTVRHLAGRYAAVLAVALCMLSNAYLWVCHNARPSAFMALFIMAATYFIVTAGDKPRLRRQVLIGVMTLLALLSYNASITTVVVMTIGVLFVGTGRWRLFLSLLIPLAVFMPWFLYTKTLYATKDRLKWWPEGDLTRLPAGITDFSFNMDFLGIASASPIAFAVVSLVWLSVIGLILYGLSRINRFGVMFGLMWFAQLAFGLFSLIVFNADPLRVERYFTITVLIQAAALATALTSLPVQFKAFRFAWLRPVACAMALALATVGMTRGLSNGYKKYDMDFVENIKNKAPDVKLIYVFQDPVMIYMLGYHLKTEVYSFANVYGLETFLKAPRYGIEPTLSGAPPINPAPHEGVDEMVVVMRGYEIDTEPGALRSSATLEMREKLNELIISYDNVEKITVDSGTLYYLRR